MGHGGDNTTQRHVPTKVTGGGIDEAVVSQVTAGERHSMALTASGELYAWGWGEYGQLGHGDIESLNVPRVVGGIEAVTGMAGGGAHSLVVTAEGHVMAFGSNGIERYEDSDGEDLAEPVIVVDGQLGLGVGVVGALTPTAIDGITMNRGEEGKEGKE